MITLYTIKDIDKNSSTVIQKQVEWRLRNYLDKLSIEEAVHTVVDASSGEFESSLICCKHPEGKVWESMFISTSRNGASGLAVTWYGKPASRGQLITKPCSESDWYTLVKSKVVGKGYDIDSFVGRDRALMNSHQYVTDIHETSPSLPAMAFMPWQAQAIIDMYQGRGLGNLMAQAFCGITPVRNFLDKLAANGHDVGQRIHNIAQEPACVNSKELLVGVADQLSSVKSPDDGSLSRKPTKQPEVNREEVYAEAWGGFA